VVRVRPIPRVRSGALLRFNSVRDGAAAVIAIVAANLNSLARCELLNADGIAATNHVYGATLPQVPTLILEFQADEATHTRREFESARAAASLHNATSCEWCATGEDLDELWELRRGCYPAAAKYRGQRLDKVFLTDTCVPISRLAECIAETERAFTEADLPCIICAHIADGNFHCCVPYQPHELGKIEELERRVIRHALALGGTVSGEHGVGVGKMEHIIEEHGAHYIHLMRRIKAALDPHAIMNPDKVFRLNAPPPPLSKL